MLVARDSHDRLALQDWRAAKVLLESLQRVGARPYDLRHSYLTESLMASKNIHATQKLALRAYIRMTDRYTLAAVDPVLLDVVSQLGARLPVPRAVPRGSVSKSEESRKHSKLREGHKVQRVR